MRRNDHIHGLRGALAFLLFIFHVANSGLPTFGGVVGDAAQHVFSSLEFGVELFFGISGIVIVNAFRQSDSVADFAFNRVTRIYPVLWVTLSLIIVLSRFDARHVFHLDGPVLLVNYLALTPVIPLKLIHPAAWSISFEFVFYGLFIAYALLGRVAPKAVAVWVVGALAALLIATHVRALGFLIGFLVVLAPPMLAGAGTRLGQHAGMLLLLSMLGWYTAFRILGMPQNAFGTWPEAGTTCAAVALYGASAVLAYLGLRGVFEGRGTFAGVLRSAPMQWLGTVSFSLYLWQTLVMAMVKKLMQASGLVTHLQEWSQVAFLLLAVGPTLLVSRWSQLLLEDRLTRALRRQWVRR